MCGIAGKISHQSPEEMFSTVQAMSDALRHRGPDGEGIWQGKNIVLGHRRLAIIDLSPSAAQPMTCRNKRFHIVYNGEIYNYPELKQQLKDYGIPFTTESDTEVILAAYEVYGEKCLSLFNGMFAFAIWDEKEKQLFCARDRFGKKPFFYFNANNTFVFASELKAFEKDIEVPKKISYESVNCFLALGYILNPQTIYEDIYQLPPASYIRVSEEGKILQKESYWNYADCFRKKTTDPEKIITANILELLKQAVRRRLIADVPVGAFLSGGIDSTSVVSLMKEYHEGTLHTFSVGFENPSYDEQEDANRAASIIGSDHHPVLCSSRDDSLFDEAVQAFDPLFSDTSMIPMVQVSKEAAKKVKVVLSGDGGDEMFGGYTTYLADQYYRAGKIIPRPIKKMIVNLTQHKASQPGKKISRALKVNQFFYGAQFDFRKAHYSWRLLYRPEERIKILGEKNSELVYDSDPVKQFYKYYEKVNDLAIMDQHFYVDGMTWLTDDILVKSDRAAMHASIEARCPFLDIDLVNYIASIPPDKKISGGRLKILLKKSMQGTIPDFIIHKKKSGFNAPVHQWLHDTKENEFKAFARYVLRNKLNIG